jgi:hypothetical protein
MRRTTKRHRTVISQSSVKAGGMICVSCHKRAYHHCGRICRDFITDQLLKRLPKGVDEAPTLLVTCNIALLKSQLSAGI